ncbi:MAG: hypothetical protein WCK02_13570 [Bacteroidota bacterium]
MENKTNIEILSDIATETNRVIEFKEEQYPLSSYSQIPRLRTSVYMPNNASKTSYFVWSCDPYGEIGENTVFCGAFIPISSGITGKINIRKKNIIDKLNIFKSNDNHSSLPETFDSKVIISGDDLSMMKTFFNNVKLQNKILEILDISDIIKISINEIDVDFVPELKGKSHLCILNKQDWYMEKEQIEKLFGLIEQIKKLL